MNFCPGQTTSLRRYPWLQSVVFVICCHTSMLAQEPQAPIPIPLDEATSPFMDAVEAHMDYVTEHSYDQVGVRTTPMWLSTIDIRTNGLPDPLLPQTLRWANKLTSAGGANLYWDQPTILVAFELSKRTGCKCYSDAASAYITAYFDDCLSATDLRSVLDPRLYYDVTRDQLVDTTTEQDICQPYTPAWETSWTIDAKSTEQQIRAFIQACSHCEPQTSSVPAAETDQVDPDRLTANAQPNLPLESEIALIESLCWLSTRGVIDRNKLTDQALALARRRMDQRNRKTGLISTQPNANLDKNDFSTTQIGSWSATLLRAADQTGIREFQQIAADALIAWLKSGFDHEQNKYYQQLNVRTGQPAQEQDPEQTATRSPQPPRRHVEIFDLQTRPTFNAPMSMAEACLSLYEKTNDPASNRAVQRWVRQVRQSLPANAGRGAYAEDYGRVIHFLVRASEIMKRPAYRKLAQQVAFEAMDQLYVPRMGMFRSHPNEDRCDAADGPGFLLLALMYMEGSDPTVNSAFQF